MGEKNKKKKGRPKRVLLVAGLMAAIIVIAGCILINMELSKIKKAGSVSAIPRENETFDTDDNAGFGNDAMLLNPSDVAWPEGIEPITDQDMINILLIGQDKRPNQERGRSDSMILVSYDRKSGVLTLVSLMRDMYVQIPGYSDNRLNATYQFGGMALLDETIKENFGITVNGNIEVDFEQFTSIIDALGGLEITLNSAEATYLSRSTKSTLVSGENHLNGQQALMYSRIRYIGKADYERTERQRTILLQAFNVTSRLNLTSKLDLLNKVLPLLTTDMTKEDILRDVYTILQNGVKRTQTLRIPADGMFKPAVIRKMDVLLPDLTANRALLKQYLTEQ
ncbi:LCP family protein [Oscillospiraceae bacterium WX1]